MILSFPNVETTYPAKRQISPDVNSVLALDVQLTPVTSGPMKGWSKFTVTGDQPEAGGMRYFELGFPDYPDPLPYTGLDYDLIIPVAEYPNLAQLETDLVAVANGSTGPVIPNKAPGSFQFDFSKKPMIADIDPGWTPIGMTVAPPVGDLATHVSLRHKMDFQAGTYGFLSLNGVAAPANQLALLPSNWGRAMNLQLQAQVLQPGSVTVYLRNLAVSMSDRPF